LFFSLSLQAEEYTFTVVIDAGHGGRDPGAIGATAKEKDINLAVALKLGNLIESKHSDVQVVYTRKRDVFVELDERANIANRNKANLFISIHANAVVRGARVTGTETFTLGLARSQENLEVAMRENSAILLEDDYLQKYEGFDPNSSESYIIFEFMQNKHMEQSIVFASEIQKSFAAIGRGDRGVKQAGLLVLRKTGMPSVLVELGFITNRGEEQYMKSAEGQNRLAKSLYMAFLKYKQYYDRRKGTLSQR
jgi:N-acetylmuramoyl-L-alanine amidase